MDYKGYRGKTGTLRIIPKRAGSGFAPRAMGLLPSEDYPVAAGLGLHP